MDSLNNTQISRRHGMAHLYLHRNQKIIWNRLRAKYQDLPAYESGRYLIAIALMTETNRRPVTINEIAGRKANDNARQGVKLWQKRGYIEIVGAWPTRWRLSDKGRMIFEEFLRLVIADLHNMERYIELFS